MAALAALSCAAATLAQDASFYGLFKEQSLLQAGDGAPILASPPYRFSTFVDPSGPGRIKGASVKRPNGTIQALSQSQSWESFHLDAEFSLKAALDAAYPSGAYLLTINTLSQGAKAITLSLPTDNYPNDPHLANFTAAQTINAGSDFTLRWDAFADGTPFDYVRVEVNTAQEDTVFASGEPGEAGALDGTSTSVTIPAGRLAAGSVYVGTLMFVRIVQLDTTSYAGVTGVAGFIKQTTFTLATPGGGTGADVEVYLVGKQRFFEQTSSGPPGLEPTEGYRFDANILQKAPGLVLSAQVIFPDLSSRTLSIRPTERAIDFKEYFDSAGALDAAYASGLYAFGLNTIHDGARLLALAMPGAAYPEAPHVSNFGAAQAFDASAPFTLRWDALSGGTANDMVLVEVQNDATGEVLAQSPEPGEPGVLPGTATSWVLPANTLAPGQSYRGRIQFIKVVGYDTVQYPGATGVVFFGARTRFRISTAPGASGPDVSVVVVGKGRSFKQSGAGSPVADPDRQAQFTAFAEARADNLILSATLRLPNGQQQPMADEGKPRIQQRFTSQAALDAAYPNGTYQVILQTVHDGLRTITLTVNGDAYPPAPHVSNFAAAQAINPVNAFTLAWDAFPAAEAADYVQVGIERQDQVVFRTGDPGQPGALDGTAVGVSVPANTLSLGRAYGAWLTLAHGVSSDTTSYPGVAAFGAYWTDTAFQVATTGTATADVAAYVVAKGQAFVQTGLNAPTPLAGTPYEVSVNVGLASPQSLTSATLQRPNAQPLALSVDSDGTELHAAFATRGDLDAAFPNGTYLFELNTIHDGQHNLWLGVTGDNYPSAPRLLNPDPSRQVDPAADLNVIWEPLAGGMASDYISLQIIDETDQTVFATPEAEQSGAMTGLATSVLIPKGRLSAGHAYQGMVIFAKVHTRDTTSYPGAVGLSAYYSRTTFTLSTGGTTPPPQPRLSGFQVLPDGSFGFRVNGDSPRSYRIETSVNLPTWELLYTTNSPGAVFDVVDPGVSNRAHRFYRITIAPGP